MSDLAVSWYRILTMYSKLWMTLGCFYGFFGVALGAFGAHALKASLSEKALSIYQTAVHYQFVHALALMGLGVWAFQYPTAETRFAGFAFALGVVLFSGSLYLLALTDYKGIGMMTPIGGVAFLLGWISFGFLAWRVQ